MKARAGRGDNRRERNRTGGAVDAGHRRQRFCQLDSVHREAGVDLIGPADGEPRVRLEGASEDDAGEPA